MGNLLNTGVASVGDALIAIGALGTASYGLVDASKAIWNGGPSSAGFGAIQRAATPFASALTVGAGPHWPGVLKSHWINGGPLDDQKAKAKALIRLGLTTDSARTIANAPVVAGRIDAAVLITAVTHVNAGVVLTPEDLNELGRLDAIVSAALDAGFERADQRYRSCARLLACGFAVVLAVIAAILLVGQQTKGKFDGWAFVTNGDLVTAVLVGLISTPLAPVAKDLASALNTAASAFKAAKA